MKKREFHLGPGAASLLLIALVLSMSVLGLLSLTSARSDDAMTARSAAVAQEIARLNEISERSLSELDAVLAACSDAQSEEEYLIRIAENLPIYMTLDERAVLWTEAGADGRELECGAEILPLGSFPRTQWTIHRHWAGIGGEL